MQTKSLRGRTTLAFALYTASLMLVVGIAFYSINTVNNARRAHVALMQTARDLRDHIITGEESAMNPAKLIRDEKDDVRSANVALVIFDKYGRVLGQSQGAVPRWPGHDARWRITSFISQGRTIVIGAPWYKTVAELRERLLLLLALSAMVVGGSALGAWVLVGRILAPIGQLAAQAQLASTESLRVHLDAPSQDEEMVRLVATLNDLLTRLEQTAAARGHFYAAAAHELRTPLQALTGHLEVSLSRPRSSDDYESVLRESHVQAERLTELVQELLLLNQLDTGSARPPSVLLDLADICESEITQLRPLAKARNIAVQESLPTRAEFNAPWNHVVMLVRNILENAVKYASANGKVRIEVTAKNLLVTNDFDEGRQLELDKLFAPFYRPDVSRNSLTGGNGLGLAVCRAICDVNGWSIELSQSEGQVRVEVGFG